ncbi:hypothetical protein [Microbacterium aurugineum]|uniref:hypothetical protein n=1 Tax=Microbacterium aurugineum TaxID=2851642 RepID=UPI0020BE54AC|nr:hypothetical protein [Microbacterium aurugineum]MCK8477936.1 hypothetical protein [Microbacterium aurugineum]
MDEFEKVRRIKPEIDGAEENLAAARALLLTEIQEESRPARPRAARRPWYIAAGAIGAAAAVTAGVLVVSAITAPSPAPTVEAVPTSAPGSVAEPSPMPSPTVTPMAGPEVLLSAANAAAGFTPPTLAPGQYLRREWTAETLSVFDPELGYAGEPDYGASRAAASSGWVITRGGADYAPADLHSEWYREWGAPIAGAVYGDQAQGHAQQNDAMQIYGPAVALFPSDAPRLPEGGGEDILWFFESMPRDPADMVAWIHDYMGADEHGWADGKVGWLLIGLLSHNVGDPEMRAAMYRTLSRLPGSTVGDEVNGARTVVFDSHLGSSESAETSLRRFTVTIDMATGIVTETTDTTSVGEGLIPADVPNSRMTFKMSVVDSLP